MRGHRRMETSSRDRFGASERTRRRSRFKDRSPRRSKSRSRYGRHRSRSRRRSRSRSRDRTRRNREVDDRGSRARHRDYRGRSRSRSPDRRGRRHGGRGRHSRSPSRRRHSSQSSHDRRRGDAGTDRRSPPRQSRRSEGRSPPRARRTAVPEVVFASWTEARAAWAIDVDRPIGRGQQGAVYPCELPPQLAPPRPGAASCVKVLEDGSQWAHEVDAMRATVERAGSSDIAPFLCPLRAVASVRDGPQLLLAMERHRESLWAWGNRVGEEVGVAAWAETIAQVLLSLHVFREEGLVHGDASPMNVVVSAVAAGAGASVAATVDGRRVTVPCRHVRTSVVDFGEARLVSAPGVGPQYPRAWRIRKDVIKFLHSLYSWPARARLLVATGCTSTKEDRLRLFFERDRGPVPPHRVPAHVAEDAEFLPPARVSAARSATGWELIDRFDREVLADSETGSPIPPAIQELLAPVYAAFRDHGETRGYKTKFLVPEHIVNGPLRPFLSPSFIEPFVRLAESHS